MKIYMCVKDENTISKDTTIFVTNKDDAEKLVQYGEAKYYETLNTLTSKEVSNIYKDKIGRG